MDSVFSGSSGMLTGDNFFKSVSYTIEALCAATFMKEKDDLRAVEAQILSKRAELSKFESEYREVCVCISSITFNWINYSPVSYTHLTLPTKRIV